MGAWLEILGRCQAAGRLVDWQMWIHISSCRTAGRKLTGKQADAESRVLKQAEVGSGQAAEVQNRIQSRVRAKPGSLSSQQRMHWNGRQKEESVHKLSQQQGVRNKQSQTGQAHTGTDTESSHRRQKPASSSNSRNSIMHMHISSRMSSHTIPLTIQAL